MNKQAALNSQMVDAKPATSEPTAKPPKRHRAGAHLTLIHARDGFQMDTSTELAYRHVSHAIDGVLMMLKFQATSSDMLCLEGGR